MHKDSLDTFDAYGYPAHDDGTAWFWPSCEEYDWFMYDFANKYMAG